MGNFRKKANLPAKNYSAIGTAIAPIVLSFLILTLNFLNLNCILGYYLSIEGMSIAAGTGQKWPGFRIFPLKLSIDV